MIARRWQSARGWVTEIERIAELVGDGSYAALEQYIVRRIVGLKDQLKGRFYESRDVGEMQGR